MIPTWKTALVAVAAAMVLAPAVARAICGDLNNDGVRTTADAIVLSQCIANGGTCPAVAPGPLCGTGSLAACGDVLGDGDVSFPVGQNADLAVLLQSLAGLATLYDICEGPGAAPVGCPGTVTLGSQTITSSQTWPANCTIRINGTVTLQVAPATGAKVASVASATKQWKSAGAGAGAPWQVSNVTVKAWPAGTPTRLGSRRTLRRA